MKRTSVINKSIIKILNKEFCLTVLRSLLEAVRNERPQRHYDNMPNTRQCRFKSFLRRQTLRGFHSHPEAMISLQPTFSLFPKLKEMSSNWNRRWKSPWQLNEILEVQRWNGGENVNVVGIVFNQKDTTAIIRNVSCCFIYLLNR